MFELADYLVGIYKVNDCTASLTIQNFDKQRVLGIAEKEGEKENQAENSFVLQPSSPVKLSQGHSQQSNAEFNPISQVISMPAVDSPKNPVLSPTPMDLSADSS